MLIAIVINKCDLFDLETETKVLMKKHRSAKLRKELIKIEHSSHHPLRAERSVLLYFIYLDFKLHNCSNELLFDATRAKAFLVDMQFPVDMQEDF